MEKIKKIEIKDNRNTNSISKNLFENLNNIEYNENNIKKIEELIKKIEELIKKWKIIFNNKDDYNEKNSLFEEIKERNEHYKNIKNMEKYKIEATLTELDFVIFILQSELNVEKWNFDSIFLIKDFYKISKI